jgi:hypothetical protein
LLNEREVGKRIRRIGCDLEQVTQLLNDEHRFNGLCRLLGDHIDIDRLDYLMRDAASAGVGYGQFDLDWMINSMSLHLDNDGRPRLQIEVYRGLAAVEQFSAARRSMYSQVYYHATVRGAGRLLRAVFERASDPERPKEYKDEAQDGVPSWLHPFLGGNRPTLDEFLKTDDATILTALRTWSGCSKDAVLRYLASCFLERRLYKEVQIGTLDWETAYQSVRDETKAALCRLKGSDLPTVGADNMHDLDYLVLTDTCDFKADANYEGVLFDTGESAPKSFEEAEKAAGHEPMKGSHDFSQKRLFVASEVADSVKDFVRAKEG